MKTSTYLVPHDAYGGICHWTPEQPGTITPTDAPGWSLLSVHTWSENRPFTGALRLDRSVKGRSARYTWWVDTIDPSFRYPMFTADLIDMVQKVTMVHGTAVGTWQPIRRGKNYAVRYVGPARAQLPDEWDPDDVQITPVHCDECEGPR